MKSVECVKILKKYLAEAESTLASLNGTLNAANNLLSAFETKRNAQLLRPWLTYFKEYIARLFNYPYVTPMYAYVFKHGYVFKFM